MIIGDFNKILYNDEEVGGWRAESLTNDLKSAIQHCGLIDIGCVRYKYTWNNGRYEDENTHVRLDRALVYEAWLSLFPHNRLQHEKFSMSHHTLLFASSSETVYQTKNKRMKAFKFEEF